MGAIGGRCSGVSMGDVMTIEVTCESCFRDYRLKDQLAGKTIRCKECREPIRVPAVDDDEIEDYGDIEVEDYGTSVPPQRGSFTKSVPAKTRKRNKKSSNSPPSRFPLKYQVLCSGGMILGGVLLPKTIAVFSLLWATIALGVSLIGVLWLAFNLFKSNPFDALIMILLPFVGFIGISRRVDFLNDENDRPYRWVIRGFLSMVIALFTAIFVKGVEENLRYAPSFFASDEQTHPPPHGVPVMSGRVASGAPSVSGRTGPGGAYSGSTSSGGGHSGPSAYQPSSQAGRERGQPRIRSVHAYRTLPGPVDDVTAKLDQRFQSLPQYVPGSIEINENENRIYLHVTERPSRELTMAIHRTLLEEGVETGASRSSTPTRKSPQIVGTFSPGPSVFIYYNSLPAAPEESLPLIQKTLSVKEYVLADQAFLRTDNQFIVVRVKTKDDLQHRDEIQELLKSSGIDVRE